MIQTKAWKGVITALITPFDNNYIDKIAYYKLIDNQINAGVSGVISCGTTGEAPTLSYEEKITLFEYTIDACQNRIITIANIGSNCTSESVRLAKAAQSRGINVLMAVVPYYNKPSQEGLYQHYKAINDAVDIPIIVYLNPARTVIDLSDEIIVKLAELSNIVALKDGGADLCRPLRLQALISKEFYQFSADDATALAYNASGGMGCISAAANIVPDICCEIQRLWFNHDHEAALLLKKKMLPLYRALFCETNPGAVKYAASLMNICKSELRLPMVIPTSANQKLIKTTMETLGLIKPDIIEQILGEDRAILL